jgi:hypothetical protein
LSPTIVSIFPAFLPLCSPQGPRPDVKRDPISLLAKPKSKYLPP